MTPRRVFGALVLAVAAAGCASSGGVSRRSAPPPSLLGRFTDDYGNSFQISDTLFEQLPSGKFRIVEWNADGQFFIARNADTNPSDAGRWSRVDWMRLDGMAPYGWAFCLTAYRAATRDEARATPSANRAEPRRGCNAFPFSRMKPSL